VNILKALTNVLARFSHSYNQNVTFQELSGLE